MSVFTVATFSFMQASTMRSFCDVESWTWSCLTMFSMEYGMCMPSGLEHVASNHFWMEGSVSAWPNSSMQVDQIGSTVEVS